MKKLFFKVYANSDLCGSNDAHFIERANKITSMYGLDNYANYLEAEADDNKPVLIPIFLTEQEFKKLPMFKGF